MSIYDLNIFQLTSIAAVIGILCGCFTVWMCNIMDKVDKRKEI